MDILFLGTGAVDWDVKNSNLGDIEGVNRRCCSILINKDLLIDPNHNVPEALSTLGEDFKKINTVLITHSHDDHFNPDTLLYIANDHPITVYGDSSYPNLIPDHENITFISVHKNEEFTVNKYTIKAVESTHSVSETNEMTLNFSISDGESNIFYGCDGAWMLPSSVEAIEHTLFDCMIMDATFGNDAQLYRVSGNQIFFHHNNPTLLQMLRSAFFNIGCADEKTLFVASHLSKTYYPNTKKAETVLKPLGYTPAYDGMRISVLKRQ